MLKLLKTGSQLLKNDLNLVNKFMGASLIHTSSVCNKVANAHNAMNPKKWLSHNKVIFEPQDPSEEPRKAVITN